MFKVPLNVINHPHLNRTSYQNLYYFNTYAIKVKVCNIINCPLAYL